MFRSCKHDNMQSSLIVAVTLGIVVLLGIIVYAESGDDGGDDLGISMREIRAKIKAKKRRAKEEDAEDRRSTALDAARERKIKLRYKRVLQLLDEAKEDVEKYEDIANNLREKVGYR